MQVLNSLPSSYVLSENVVEIVTGKLQNRLLDKHAAARAWAAKGLRRVVDVDGGGRGYPTLTLLKEVLSSESSAVSQYERHKSRGLQKQFQGEEVHALLNRTNRMTFGGSGNFPPGCSRQHRGEPSRCRRLVGCYH